jgi:hypothetical protein
MWTKSIYKKEMKWNIEDQNWKKKNQEKDKKTTIKKMSNLFDIKTKQNQIKKDEIDLKKRIQKK